MRKLREVSRKFCRSMVAFEGDASFIAKGFALGSFIGMLPIPGFHILSSLSLAAVFKLNKKSAFLGVIKTNFLTIGFILALNFYLGKKITGYSVDFILPETISIDFLLILFQSGFEVFYVLLVGGIISGIFSAIINYYFILFIIKNYRNHVYQQ